MSNKLTNTVILTDTIITTTKTELQSIKLQTNHVWNTKTNTHFINTISNNNDLIDSITSYAPSEGRGHVRLPYTLQYYGLLADFSPEIAATTQPLSSDVTKTILDLDPDHNQAFWEFKVALLWPPVFASFNPKRLVILQMDASCPYGLGYALLQEHSHGQLQLVHCGSWFLLSAPTSGDFSPRLVLFSAFGDKSGELSFLAIFKGILVIEII